MNVIWRGVLGGAVRAGRCTARTVLPELPLVQLLPARLDVGCSHWTSHSRGAYSTVPLPQDQTSIEFSEEAIEWEDASTVPVEWEDADMDVCLEAYGSEGIEISQVEPSIAPRRPRPPTSIKKLNKLLSRHSSPDILESELDEKFVRGSGPGGQCINKTSSSVSLIHLPTGIRIQAQPTRSREQNRKIARRILRDRLDTLRASGEYLGNGADLEGLTKREKMDKMVGTWSKEELRWEKERRRKINREKKKKKKKRKEGEDEGEEEQVR
ncbi:peptide chain release factor, partial [Tremellales sp. Uapishka_1]